MSVSEPGEAGLNEVTLRGRVTGEPVARVLPSGAELVSIRVSLPRARTTMTSGSRATSDWMDCTAWSGRSRRAVLAWRVDDVVEVGGALRRRFYRGAAGTVSRVEVEVLTARLVRRAAT